LKLTLDKSTHLLIGILVLVMFTVIGVTTYQLYDVAFHEEYNHLTETVKSQARLIEAVAKFDREFSVQDIPGGAEAATLWQIREAHDNFKSLHRTGEFTLGRLDHGYIDFLLYKRNKPDPTLPAPPDHIQMGSEFAVPMQLALRGKSGSIIAKDYRGVLVLAAYEPVAILDYGIVAKIDIEEIRGPFVTAGLTSLVLGTILVVVAALGFRNVTRLLIDRIYRSEETHRLAMEATQDGLWDWDISSGNVYYSPGWMNILGGEVVSHEAVEWESRIHSDDKNRVLKTLRLHLAGRSEDWQEEHRIRRDDGAWSWVLTKGMVVRRDESGNPLRMVGTITDINFKKANEEVIWRQANYDNLTSLPNRKLFLELLNRKINQSHRNSRAFWVMFLDLDGFKVINDTLGHHIGDELLVKVAQRLKAGLRESDIVARLGGDEFVVILSDVDDAVFVDRIAAKLINVVGRVYELEQECIFISTSIGIANYPRDADNANDLVKFADQSMYAAKRDGKNRYSYFTPELQHESQVRMQIATELRNGLANGEFQLYYQPIVCLRTGEIRKAEVLIRWIHPERGVISPVEFIPIAEESAIIHELGSWVFEAAIRQLKQWQSHVNLSLKLSINMSPYQFLNNNPKHEKWLGYINEQGISGNNIVIEITEGLLLKNDKPVKDKLVHYHDLGVQVAIDDFGTGYSSLSYLSEFDIDYLKIDQAFVCKLGRESREQALSEAIVVMAHKLGLMVIAEGIETEQQRDLLIRMGCDYGQGYLFSMPLPADQFEQAYLQSFGCKRITQG